MVCTEIEAIYVANEDASIKFEPAVRQTEIAANKLSPAPATSNGLTVKAGKCSLSIKPSFVIS